jgi:hypothetical protein
MYRVSSLITDVTQEGEKGGHVRHMGRSTYFQT